MRPRLAGLEGHGITAAIGTATCAVALVGVGNVAAMATELRNAVWGLFCLVVLLLWAWDTEVAPVDVPWYEHDGVF